MLDVGFSMLDVGFSMLDVGFSMLDASYGLWDFFKNIVDRAGGKFIIVIGFG